MPEATTKVSGPAQAAILLMALGEQEAAEVLRFIEPREVEALGAAMEQLNNVTQDQIGEVLDSFVTDVGNQSSLGIGSRDYFEKVLNKALGMEKAKRILPRVLKASNPKGLEPLMWMSPQAIAEMIGKEHPQFIAMVLAYVDSSTSGKVLALLPESLQADVLMRVANLDGVPPSALKELEDILSSRLEAGVEPIITGVGGAKRAADILNAVPSEIETAVMEKIAQANAGLAGTIQDLMMTFETLNDVDDRGMQSLLREVPSDKLVIALKAAAPETREKIFKNMSSRAAEVMRDDLDARGPVRLSEVEATQKEIMEVARRMLQEGKIIVRGKGERFV